MQSVIYTPTRDDPEFNVVVGTEEAESPHNWPYAPMSLHPKSSSSPAACDSARVAFRSPLSMGGAGGTGMVIVVFELFFASIFSNLTNV